MTSDDYDAVVAGLVLHHIPDPAPAVAEMVRAARPGGAVGAYVWDYHGQMQRAQYFWDAVAVTESAAAALDPRPHFHTCEPEPMANLFRAAGLDDVAVEAIDLPMAFRDLDEFWLPHTMAGAAVAQRYVRDSMTTGRPRSGSSYESRSPLPRMARSFDRPGMGSAGHEANGLKGERFCMSHARCTWS